VVEVKNPFSKATLILNPKDEQTNYSRYDMKKTPNGNCKYKLID